MITRLWRGWTATEDADAYERFLLTELFPSMREIRGFRRAEVLFVFRRGRWGAGWSCGSGAPRYGGPTSAAEILARRFAEGELSADEYRERRAVLGGSPEPAEGTADE